jgi:hypothetical protein
VTPWLTLIAGLRYSHFDSGSVRGRAQPAVVENVPDPRLGVAIRIPRLNWVFRGFYGVFYQPPPLLTATGPLFDLANSQNFTFGALPGERDHEYQFGVAIPFRGWVLDIDTFQTSSRNWLDHNNIGESNPFWPFTWDRALIQGWETTLRSPRILAPGSGPSGLLESDRTGLRTLYRGLICPTPAPEGCQPDPGLSPVDHDQRNTLNFGGNAILPGHVLPSTNVYYGSGFHNGSPNAQYPRDYLPSHTRFDISLAKSFGESERFKLSLTALNVSNRRALLDNSLTFGGFHFNDPRELYAEFRWRLHY